MDNKQHKKLVKLAKRLQKISLAYSKEYRAVIDKCAVVWVRDSVTGYMTVCASGEGANQLQDFVQKIAQKK